MDENIAIDVLKEHGAHLDQHRVDLGQFHHCKDSDSSKQKKSSKQSKTNLKKTREKGG